MKIVVFIKQVPDNTRLRFQDGQPVLAGTPMMMNPFDEYALETALRLKEQAAGDSTIVVISLGSETARETLKKAIAAGADQAFLLSDPLLASADSALTAQVFAAAIRRQIPDFDLLLFGQSALDDASAQTGPQVAECLELPSATFVKNAQLNNDGIRLFRETEQGTEEWQMSLPGVLCLIKCDYELRSSNIKGVMKANKAEIPVVSATDLGLGESGIAVKTRVEKIWARPPKPAGRIVDGSDSGQAVVQLLDYLQAEKIL